MKFLLQGKWLGLRKKNFLLKSFLERLRQYVLLYTARQKRVLDRNFGVVANREVQ